MAQDTVLDPIRLAEAQLVATEAVAHFATETLGPLDLVVHSEPIGWRVEITGDRHEPFQLTELAQRILSAYSHRWGEEPSESRRTIWFEVKSVGRQAVVEELQGTDLLLRARVDVSYQDEVIRRYGPLASGISRRFRGKGVPDSDLEQVAMLGLISALHRFEADKGEFEPFAAVTIAGELKRHLRDRAWSVRVPRALQESTLEVGRSSEQLTQELGRHPTASEIASDLGVEQSDVLDAQRARVAYRWESIDVPDPETGSSMADSLRDGASDAAELWPELEEQIRLLPEREQEIIYLRFFEDLTQSEIAERMGISQMHVSRLLARALERLRLASALADE